ncbi:heavy-metal-associated domain-containing protein [Corynebacterium kroppenstedtii]|uniref:heavy-metal-associated domain-containing protein n=1 Tax=Corynebacterium sp. PCR 32 TaxID=3351342 RepID=UPI003096F947
MPQGHNKTGQLTATAADIQQYPRKEITLMMKNYTIAGMSSATTAATIKNAVSQARGVQNVTIYDDGHMTVEGEDFGDADITTAVSATGHTLEDN